MPAASALSHVTLTVTDLESSVAWYERTLGLRRARTMAGPGRRRTLLVADSGLVIGLQAHDRTAEEDRFDPARVGLDHLSIACADRAEVLAWLAKLDGLGVAHSPISEEPANIATCPDPDGIAIEFFAPPGA
jgi:catechol 2,3-dioxygenase-like lactoylglutathione lyase family enzyme